VNLACLYFKWRGIGLNADGMGAYGLSTAKPFLRAADEVIE
jgi:hypothetical protein